MGLREGFRERIGPMIKEGRIVFSGLRSSVLSFLGVMIIVFFFLVALFAPVLAPPGPGDPFEMPYEGPINRGYITVAPTPPSLLHPFGTLDGCDLFHGCVWGTRTALQVSFLAIFIELVLGLFVGSIAGYFGGYIDEIMMRLTDLFFAFPRILFAMIFVVALPTQWSLNLGFVNISLMLTSLEKIAIAIAIAGWPLFSRLIRGEIVKVKSEDYIQAAKAVGGSGIRIMVKHILPNTIFPIVIMSFLEIGGISLSAATFSFLGLGPHPGSGYSEWGSIISDSRRFITTLATQDPLKYLHTFLFPTVFLSLFVLGWSLIGDVLRNILDPMLRRK